MLNKALATRYAQALFVMAKSSPDGLDKQLQELIKVKGYFDHNLSLKTAVQSPTVPAPIKKSILKRLLDKRVDETTLSFLYVLVDKSRELYVDAILDGYRELLRNERSEVEIHIKTAAPLADAVLSQVQQTLLGYTGKKVELKTEVVPDLLGGMVIQIGDRVIDGSLRRQLLQIQERLTKVSAATVGG